jgi:biotin operon repressor
MGRKAMPWFRFYVETPSDRKVRRLKPEHRWLWVCVLCLARQSPTPGALLIAADEPASPDDLADLAGLPVASVRKGLTHLRQLGMIEKCSENGWELVAAWNTRQYASDTSTDRVRAYRTRANPRSSNGVGTFQERSSNGGGNAPETETETDNPTCGPSLAAVDTCGEPRTA